MSSVKVITEPSVFVLGRQAVDEDELGRFLEHVGSPDWTTDAPSAGERLIEVAGRACYQSWKKPRPGGNAAYIGHILEEGHGSVTEQAVWTVAIAGISRSLSHQLIRHRSGISPAQLSQRFHDESDGAFVMPPALVGCEDTEAGMTWLSACEWSANRYRLLARQMEAKAEFDGLPPTLRRKRARETARSVLLECVETMLVLQGNGRAWRWVCENRGQVEADLEIRRLAVALARVFRAEAENLFGDLETYLADDGREAVRCRFSKV